MKGEAYATTCSPRVSKIQKAVEFLQPSLTSKKILKLANAVDRASSDLSLDWMALLSVAFVESSLYRTVHKKGGLCLMGIYFPVWGEYLRLNKKRLTQDLDYCILTGGRVLKQRHVSLYLKDECWAAAYHSYTKKHKDAYCKKYLRTYHNLVWFNLISIGT